MGGSSFPSYGKSPQAARALGKPTLKQAQAFKLPKSKISMPAVHIKTAIPRGHVVRGRMRGPK